MADGRVVPAPPVAQLEPGWFRATARGLERVPDADAEAEVAAGGGHDLAHVAHGHEEVPLW